MLGNPADDLARLIIALEILFFLLVGFSVGFCVRLLWFLTAGFVFVLLRASLMYTVLVHRVTPRSTNFWKLKLCRPPYTAASLTRTFIIIFFITVLGLSEMLKKNRVTTCMEIAFHAA